MAACKDMTLLERLREYAASKGMKDVKTIKSAFHEMNTNKNRFLNFNEFKAGFSEAGLDEESLLTCFKEINKYGGHKGINLQEFLIALQPSMSEKRVASAMSYFNTFDRNKDGMITPDDLIGQVNPEFHPKYNLGEWTETQVFEHVLSRFMGDRSGRITKEDFMDYYEAVSAEIEDDDVFAQTVSSMAKDIKGRLKE